jgi:hypothetical protein
MERREVGDAKTKAKAKKGYKVGRSEETVDEQSIPESPSAQTHILLIHRPREEQPLMHSPPTPRNVMSTHRRRPVRECIV